MTNPLVFEYLKNSYLKLFPSIFSDYIFESESTVLKSSIFTDVLPFIWSVSETPPCLIRSCYVDERDAAGAPDPFTTLQKAIFYKAVTGLCLKNGHEWFDAESQLRNCSDPRCRCTETTFIVKSQVLDSRSICHIGNFLSLFRLSCLFVLSSCNFAQKTCTCTNFYQHAGPYNYGLEIWGRGSLCLFQLGKSNQVVSQDLPKSYNASFD